MGTPIVDNLRNAVSRMWPFEGIHLGEQLGNTMQQRIDPYLQRMGLMPDTSADDKAVQEANQSFMPKPDLSKMRKPLKGK